MGEFTICNLCSLRRYEQRAAATQRVVTLRDLPGGGTSVYVHPRAVKPTEGHRVAWFMELPDECACWED